MKRGCLMNVGLKLPGDEGAINVYQDLGLAESRRICRIWVK